MNITLSNGYNGHTLEFCAEPLAVAGSSVKLHVAAPGKEYLIRWAGMHEYLFALGARFEHVSLAEAAWLLAGFAE
jgi:hypothetical protein